MNLGCEAVLFSLGPRRFDSCVGWVKGRPRWGVMDRFSFERRGEKECRRGEDRDFALTRCDMEKNVMEIWCDMEKESMEV